MRIVEKIDLLEEYKELYNHEMAFCDRLNGKISNALAIITVIGTGEAIVWKDCLNDGYNIILFVLCIISLQCFIYTMYKFYKAYSNYTYGYYAIKETAEFVNLTYKLGKEKNKTEQEIENHIKKVFQNNYIKAASINREQNIKKSKAHRKLNKWMIISIISVFICYVCDIIVNSSYLKSL